ncbi:hypothetical protein Tco_1102131 [Tanacetum coccineum]
MKVLTMWSSFSITLEGESYGSDFRERCGDCCSLRVDWWRIPPTKNSSLNLRFLTDHLRLVVFTESGSPYGFNETFAMCFTSLDSLSPLGAAASVSLSVHSESDVDDDS